MATPAQRAKAILDALHDGDTDNARIMRVLDAFAFTDRRGETLTTAQKAMVFIVAVRRMVREVTLSADESIVAAAAKSGVARLYIGSDGE